MIWSVSTLLRRSGSPVPACRVNFVHRQCSVLGQVSGRQVGRRRERAGDGGGRGDERRDQVGATALALPALEVAVGGRGAALPRLELVGVHAQAHRAAGAAPLTAGLLEDHVEPLVLGLQPHPDRARARRAAGCPAATCRPLITSAAARRSSMRPLVHEPTKTVSTLTSRIGVPASRPMYSRAFSAATLSPSSSKSAGRRHRSRRAARPGRGWCPR